MLRFHPTVRHFPIVPRSSVIHKPSTRRHISTSPVFRLEALSAWSQRRFLRLLRKAFAEVHTINIFVPVRPSLCPHRTAVPPPHGFFLVIVTLLAQKCQSLDFFKLGEK
jgi:hypothetical protein